jgi:hypothetical protein
LLYPIEREKQVTSKLALYTAQKRERKKKKSKERMREETYFKESMADAM